MKKRITLSFLAWWQIFWLTVIGASGQGVVNVFNNSSETLSSVALGLQTSCASGGSFWQGIYTIPPGGTGTFTQSGGGGGDFCYMYGAAVGGVAASGVTYSWAGACGASSGSTGNLISVSLGNTGGFTVNGTITIAGYPYASTIYTNSGCTTINNPTTTPQYYQFQTSGSNGTNSLDGCSQSLSYNLPDGYAGGGPSDPTSWLAVYPGESVTVCAQVILTNVAAAQTLCAMQAPAGMQPCGLNMGTPRCVYLCSDGLNISGVGTSAGCQSMAQTGTSTGNQSATNGPFSPSTSNTNLSGTNGIGWAGGTNLLTDEHGMQGFAALNADVQGLNNATVIGQTVLGNEISNSTASISQSISNSAVYLSNALRILTNGSGASDVTNWPTNYPDAAAIAYLSNASNPSTNWVSYITGGGGPYGLMGISTQSMGGFVASASNAAGSVANFTAVIPTNTGSGTGSDGVNFLVGGDASGTPLYLNLSTSALSTTVLNLIAAGKGLVLIILTVGAFVWCQNLTNESVVNVFKTPQIEGNKSEVLGTNAAIDIPTGLAYLAIIFPLLTVLPGLLIAFWPSLFSAGGMGNSATYLGTLAASPAWRMATLLFPVDGAANLLVECLVYKFVLVRIPMYVAMGVKMSMIA